MSYYRMYILNVSDKIRGVKEFDCLDDATASLLAESYSGGAAYELWNRDRLIVRRQTNKYVDEGNLAP